GMTCEKCVARVGDAIRKVPGVETVEVDLESGSARVSPAVSIEQISSAVKSAGDGRYSVEAPAPTPVLKAESQQLRASSRTIAIKGMTCASCVARVEHAIARAPGVTGVVVNLATESAQVEGGSDDEIAAAVRAAGYDIGRKKQDTSRLAALAL